jgi:uncharacterized integral membrane protein (TIGR00698 family)
MYDLDDLKKYQFLDSIEGVPPLEEPEKRSFWQRVKALIPGLLVCFIVTLAAHFISGHYTVPVMLMALLLGMSLNFMSQDSHTNPGIQYTSQSILRLGVVLIGARIAFSDILAVGAGTIVLVVCATALVILLSVVCAKLFNLEKEQGILIGGATAICGASAALAISSVLPNSKNLEQNTLLAVLSVTAMGTVSMIFYPVLIGILGYSDYQAGLFIGGTIHDVSQVVGAGYSISTQSGDVAILIKLMRVFLLIPVLLVFLYVFGKQAGDKTGKKLPIPIFLAGFLLLVVLNSFHVLPETLTAILQTSSKWLLVMAIAAVGMKTSPKTFVSMGWKSFMLVFLNTLFLAALYIAVITFNVI